MKYIDGVEFERQLNQLAYECQDPWFDAMTAIVDKVAKRCEVDAAQIVRCADCAYYGTMCPGMTAGDKGFCSDAKRRAKC